MINANEATKLSLEVCESSKTKEAANKILEKMNAAIIKAAKKGLNRCPYYFFKVPDPPVLNIIKKELVNHGYGYRITNDIFTIDW